MTKKGLYFEELSTDKTYTTHRRTITEADHVNFTTSFGFFEPLFMDRAYVETETHYGKAIVPGALTFSVAEGLAILTGILRQLQAVPQVHPVRVGKGPEVDGFLHLVAFRRSPSRIRLFFFRAQASSGGGCSGHHRRELDCAAAGYSIFRGLRGSPWWCQAAHSPFIHPARRH